MTVAQVKAMLIRACGLIVEREPYLTEIDSIIGDGDHGTGMKRGFSAVRRMLEGNAFPSAKALFLAVGMELVKTMGGASGVIFGTLFIGGLDALPDSDCLETAELAAFFEKSLLAIQRRGKAQPGQKTMLDALAPAVEAMKACAGQNAAPADMMAAASKAAAEGAEATKTMWSRMGRSKNFRENALGLPDPGAVSTSLLFQGFYEAAQNLNKAGGERPPQKQDPEQSEKNGEE